MKKLLIFALMFVPVASFAASSVRVLGSGSSALPGSGSTTKTTTPARAVSSAKVAAPKATTTGVTKTGDASTSRIGTISAKVKKPVTTTTGTTGTTTNSGSRFPVITPAQSYNTVGKPQANTGTGGTGECCNVDVQEIVRAVTEQVSDKDPRVDMIHAGNREAYWRNKVGNGVVDDYLAEGYYFMWIE